MSPGVKVSREGSIIKVTREHPMLDIEFTFPSICAMFQTSAHSVHILLAGCRTPIIIAVVNPEHFISECYELLNELQPPGRYFTDSSCIINMASVGDVRKINNTIMIRFMPYNQSITIDPESIGSDVDIDEVYDILLSIKHEADSDRAENDEIEDEIGDDEIEGDEIEGDEIEGDEVVHDENDICSCGHCGVIDSDDGSNNDSDIDDNVTDVEDEDNDDVNTAVSLLTL